MRPITRTGGSPALPTAASDGETPAEGNVELDEKDMIGAKVVVWIEGDRTNELHNEQKRRLSTWRTG